jgi:quercetin dioxygenase-like cupin family protein
MLKPIATFTLLAAIVSVAANAADRSAPVVATQVLKTSETWNGEPIAFPSGRGEVTALSIEIQPGAETGWHQHPIPSFAVVMEGTLQVTLRDGRTRRFNAGDAFAEVISTAHNGRNVGAVPTKLLVIYTGAQGATLTVKE